MAVFITLAVVSTMMTVVVSAASWNPSDKITITIRVFDYSTNTCKVVGTDTVTKGDKYIQSDKYKVPPLSKFTDTPYGRVLKVTGNMYGYYTNGCNVGTNLVFSCNANTACLTYWVDGKHADYGNGSNTNESFVQGTGTKYSWKQTIVYHANYPDGTDETYTVTYTIKGFTTIFTGKLEYYNDCGFTLPANYELYGKGYDTKNPDRARPWHKDKNPEIDPNNQYNGFMKEGLANYYTFSRADQNTTTHIYAQYSPTAPAYNVTHTDDDGTILAQDTVPGGEKTDVLAKLSDKENGAVFERWEKFRELPLICIITAANQLYPPQT